MSKTQVTIKDVARRAGVAIGTVSRILNGHSSVNSDLRAQVQKVIDEMGYQPNASARTLRTNRTQAIGIIVTDLRQPIAAAMVATASTLARRHGFAPIVGEYHYEGDREAQLLAFMRERKVDGLILSISSDRDDALVNRVKSLSTPVVLWERDTGGKLPSVRSDQRAGSARAAEVLLAAGRKRPLIISGGAHSWTGREQVAGLDGFEELVVLHTEALDLVAFRTALRDCDAVVANVHDIPMILAVAREEGLVVPGDLSLVSLGDDPFLEFTAPAITAVRTRPDLVAAQAMDILLRQLGVIADLGEPCDIIVQPEFILRNSV